jgi:hypothetical protein
MRWQDATLRDKIETLHREWRRYDSPVTEAEGTLAERVEDAFDALIAAGEKADAVIRLHSPRPLERTSGHHDQCPSCHHIRYVELGDSFNGQCDTCCLWAERRIAELLNVAKEADAQMEALRQAWQAKTDSPEPRKWINVYRSDSEYELLDNILGSHDEAKDRETEDR